MTIRITFLLLVALLTSPVSAVELDDRLVILLVGEHRNGDAQLDALRASLLESREKLGLTSQELPLVTMGFADSDTEAEYFQRLGFQQGSAPVLCLVKWGNPARFGPEKVVDDIIFRQADPDQVSAVLNGFLAATGPVKPVASSPKPQQLQVEQFTFELPTEFQLLNKSDGEALFGPASSLLGQKNDKGNAVYEIAAKTKDELPNASLALVRLKRKRNLNRRMSRMAKMFSRKVAGANGPDGLVGPTVENIRGRRYYKFEQRLKSSEQTKRREIYFHAPEGDKNIYVFTFEADEENFLGLTPLFRDVVESFDLKPTLP